MNNNSKQTQSGRGWAPSPGVAPAPGEASDRIVAEAHGVRRATVGAYRARHGIPAGGVSGRPRGSGAWVPVAGVTPAPGGDTDGAVAEAHGTTAAVVARYRGRLGIAPRWRGRPARGGE